MHARLVLFNVGPGMGPIVEKINDEMIPKLRERKGFIRATFLCNYEAGEYGALNVWESSEDAEASRKVVFPILESKLAGITKSPPTVRLFDVYEPQA